MTAPLQLKDFLGRIFQDSKNLAMKSGDENGQVTNEVCCIAKILEAAGFHIVHTAEQSKERRYKRHLVFYSDDKKSCKRTGPKEIKTVCDAWKRMGGSNKRFWEYFLQGKEIWDQIEPAQEASNESMKHSREGEAALQDVHFSEFLHMWLPALIQTMQLGVGTHLTLGTVKLRASKDPRQNVIAPVHVERIEAGRRSLVVSLPSRPNIGTLSIDAGTLMITGSEEFFVDSPISVCDKLIQVALFEKFKDMFRDHNTLVTVDRPPGLRCCCLDSDLRSGQPPKKLQKQVRKRKHVEPEPLAVPPVSPTGQGGCGDDAVHPVSPTGQGGCEDEGSQGRGPDDVEEKEHCIGQHEEMDKHGIGQEGDFPTGQLPWIGSPAGLCNVKRIARAVRRRKRHFRGRHFRGRHNIFSEPKCSSRASSSIGESPCGRDDGSSENEGVDRVRLEPSEEDDGLAAALLESQKAAEAAEEDDGLAAALLESQKAAEAAEEDVGLAAALLERAADDSLELNARDAEAAAMSASLTCHENLLNREARQMELAIRFAEKHRREVFHTVPNGNCGLSSILLGMGAATYLTKDAENCWDCPPSIRAYVVAMLLHVLAALPYASYPGREQGMTSRPAFIDDDGLATEDSLLQFGQRISENYVFVDAAFELAILCHYGFKKSLKVIKPVLGDTRTEDSVMILSPLGDGASDVHDPRAIYLFHLNENHFLPLLPVGGLKIEDSVDFGTCEFPFSRIKLTLHQFLIDYEDDDENERAALQSICEECQCDEVPHSVLVHRALTAGQCSKISHAREFVPALDSITKPFPMLYCLRPAVGHGHDPSSPFNALDVSNVLARAAVPVMEGILHLQVTHEAGGSLPTEFQVFDCGCEGVVAGISADGNAMFLVELLKTDISGRGGFTRSFVARVTPGLLKAVALRLNHGRIVLVSCPDTVVSSLLWLILEQYWNLFPMVADAVPIAMRLHGMKFVCSNGCIFEECTPGFSRASLLSKELLCPKCIVSEGLAFHEYRSTVSHGNFDLEMKYILKVRDVVEADEQHCFFPWGDERSSEAELHDMTTDSRGNAKALRWADRRFGERARGVSSGVRNDGVVDAFTQLIWCWSVKRRFYLGSKVAIAKDSILFFYGGEIMEHADIVDDCLFEAHVSETKQAGGAHKVPFMITCTNIRNEASFLACCGVGERANVRTSFVKGLTANGRSFCGIAFVVINNILANTGLAYRYDKYNFDRSSLAKCLNFEAGCGKIL